MATVCSTGCSQAHAVWAVGLTKTHGKIHGQVVLGCVSRATVMVICHHCSRTVAQPPHLKQLDRDALPAFDAGIDPGMEHNLLTMRVMESRLSSPQDLLQNETIFLSSDGLRSGACRLVYCTGGGCNCATRSG